MAPIVNAVLATPLGKAVAAFGGLTTQRSLPRFAAAGDWRRQVEAGSVSDAGAGLAGRAGSQGPARDVVLVVDTFPGVSAPKWPGPQRGCCQRPERVPAVPQTPVAD